MNSEHMNPMRLNNAVLYISLAFSTTLFAGTGGPPADRPANPAADPAAVVSLGEVRFTLLTDRLVRMEWSPGGRFEDRASLIFINRNLPVPAFSVDSSGETVVITTDAKLRGELQSRYDAQFKARVAKLVGEGGKR